MTLEIVINVAHVVLLAAYFMRDILWLRIITVTAIVLGFPYYYFQPEPLWPLIFWGFAFLIVNCYRIAQLIYDRRPLYFTDEQKRLWQTALRRIPPRYARHLFQSGSYRTIRADRTIVKQGSTLDEVLLISKGTVRITLNDIVVDHLGPGHFIGSAMFLETPSDFPAVATIASVEEVRLIVWQKRELRMMAEEDNQFSQAIAATMGLDIAYMLIRSWHRIVER